jgi:hypothetical protein
MEEAEPLLNRALMSAGVHSARNIRKSSLRPSSSQSFVGCRCGGALGCARSVDLTTVPIFFGTNRTSVCQGQLIDRMRRTLCNGGEARDRATNRTNGFGSASLATARRVAVACSSTNRS